MHCYDDEWRWQPASLETYYGNQENIWKKVLGEAYPDSGQQSVCARFFQDEPDHNRGNKPRLDVVLTFESGTWVRYHPKAELIWSYDGVTDAMQKRYNLTRKLKKEAERKRRV